VVDFARDGELVPAILTFDPHPSKIVAPARAPRLLSSPEQRYAIMRDLGIERIFVIPFDQSFANLSPNEFVHEILIGRLHAKAIMIGSNFRFGHKQAGDTLLLRKLGDELGYCTEVIPGVTQRGRMVSSTEVRRLIDEGSVSLACRLLGRPYALEGEVVRGHGVGSKQTVPTLNLSTQAEILPRTGVYITRTRDLESERKWNSITNVGYRPTFGGDQISIETFLLEGLDGEEPKRIAVEFLRRVRDERKFETPEALKAQIMKDVGRAQTYFRRTLRLY
jgi:riboflavin kinase/FMN adenylyltransferase